MHSTDMRANAIVDGWLVSMALQASTTDPAPRDFGRLKALIAAALAAAEAPPAAVTPPADVDEDDEPIHLSPYEARQFDKRGADDAAHFAHEALALQILAIARTEPEGKAAVRITELLDTARAEEIARLRREEAK